MHSKLIAFLGTVGAGKTTQINALATRLREKNRKVKTTFLLSGHIFAYFLEVFLVKIVKHKERDVYPIRTLFEEKPELFRSVFKIWMILDIISISIKYLIEIYIPSKLGYTVIVEEYLPSSIVDYLYLSKKINLEKELPTELLEFLLKLIYLIKPIQIIFLDAKDEVLVARWQRRGSPIQRPDYIKAKRTILQRIIKNISLSESLFLETGDKDIAEINEKIVRWVSSNQ